MLITDPQTMTVFKKYYLQFNWLLTPKGKKETCQPHAYQFYTVSCSYPAPSLVGSPAAGGTHPQNPLGSEHSGRNAELCLYYLFKIRQKTIHNQILQ